MHEQEQKLNTESENSDRLLNKNLTSNTKNDAINDPTLSKRARRRLEKKLKWESRKHEKRSKERLKRKQKLAEARKNNIQLGPNRKTLKKCKMATSECKTGVIIDLSFDELMSQKDMGKVIKQILRVYSLNRRSTKPMQIYLTNFNGASLEEMSKHTGYENWDLNFHSEGYLDIFPHDKLVYLTSESENVITNLEQDKIYIIGGLVDHNSQKGLCYRIAQEQNIAHGQLPISDFVLMKTRKVLTIDQVFEILLRVIEGNNWENALIQVLPTRKGVIAKTVSENNIAKNEKTDLKNFEIKEIKTDAIKIVDSDTNFKIPSTVETKTDTKAIIQNKEENVIDLKIKSLEDKRDISGVRN